MNRSVLQPLNMFCSRTFIDLVGLYMYFFGNLPHLSQRFYEFQMQTGLCVLE